jgi:hypothetical protein
MWKREGGVACPMVCYLIMSLGDDGKGAERVAC